MKKIFLLALIAGLAGCEKYRQADYSVLCDPVTEKAFLVEPGTGATSFVRETPKYNSICVKAKP